MALLAAFECDEIVVSRAQSETSLIFSSEAMELQSHLLMMMHLYQLIHLHHPPTPLARPGGYRRGWQSRTGEDVG